jgi:outer membrane lipoprotein carrier protein
MLLLSIATLPMTAETMTSQQKQAAIAKINKAASSLKTMTCTFVQTKHLSMLNDKMVSKGSMRYKQSDKLRWEYTSPYQYLFIFNGTKVYVGNKSRKDVIDTGTNKVFKEVARIMMNTVTGKALSNSSDFTVDITSTATTYDVTLVPKKKDLKQLFTKIQLIFTKTNIMISEVNIFEKNGDSTNIELKNITPNSEVNESYFTIPK